MNAPNVAVASMFVCGIEACGFANASTGVVLDHHKLVHGIGDGDTTASEASAPPTKMVGLADVLKPPNSVARDARVWSCDRCHAFGFGAVERGSHLMSCDGPAELKTICTNCGAPPHPNSNCLGTPNAAKPDAREFQRQRDADEWQRVRDLARAAPHVSRDEQLVADPHGNKYVACGFCGRERRDPAHIKPPKPSTGYEEYLRSKVATAADPVAPRHYKDLTPEPIDVISAWRLNFNLGNALKYIARADLKGTPLVDLRKAAAYLAHEIARLEQREAAKP